MRRKPLIELSVDVLVIPTRFAEERSGTFTADGDADSGQLVVQGRRLRHQRRPPCSRSRCNSQLIRGTDMKRLLFGFTLAAACAVLLLPASVGADISPTQTTQVILSCADGHSVILSADAATLTSLTADVQALNAGGASCTMDTTATDPTASAKWTVYDYNPSGHEIA